MRRPPVTERWARIGQRDPSWLIHVPKEGLCLSTFVVIRRGRRILLGRPHANNAWPEKGGFPKRHSAAIEKEGTWLMPATHLLMEEAPDRAARRIANQWAGVSGLPKFIMVQSHLRAPRRRTRQPQSKARTGSNHWDICFVYELRTKAAPKPKSWWSETRFCTPLEIRGMTLGRGHKDILKAAGYL
jgi:ADP-ribose pyrophosphatase YjhB (NUDIX family)